MDLLMMHLVISSYRGEFRHGIVAAVETNKRSELKYASQNSTQIKNILKRQLKMRLKYMLICVKPMEWTHRTSSLMRKGTSLALHPIIQMLLIGGAM